MAYYNRLPLLLNTLNTISLSECKDYEIVIVDDFSDQNHSLSVLSQLYPNLNMRIVYMSDVYDTKWYANPCVVYNAGFKEAKGDKIIIQNSECMHVGDVLSFAQQHLQKHTYLSFRCFAHEFPSNQGIRFHNSILPGGWYNHEAHRPTGFHFCNAITKDNLMKLNGFDERFATNYAWDDNEFYYRVNLLGLHVKFVQRDDIFVIHQDHRNTLLYPWSDPNKDGKSFAANQKLFEQICNEKKVRAEKGII